MLNTFLVALATLFATVGVADIAFIFAALTKDNTPRERFVLATRGVLIATGILLVFGSSATRCCDVFGITIPALRTAGGILLLLIAIDMVFARHSGATGTTQEEEAESRQRNDISVFPLAMPLLAGPGAISAMILLTDRRHGWRNAAMAWSSLRCCSSCSPAWVTLLLAIPIQRLLGITGLAVVSRWSASCSPRSRCSSSSTASRRAGSSAAEWKGPRSPAASTIIRRPRPDAQHAYFFLVAFVTQLPGGRRPSYLVLLRLLGFLGLRIDPLPCRVPFFLRNGRRPSPPDHSVDASAAPAR
jgi:multiple antibiotic resistance protein